VTHSKEQFATSPHLDSELMNAIVDALDAHTSMSSKALNSVAVRKGLKSILLNHANLWNSYPLWGRCMTRLPAQKYLLSLQSA
jgi:hypothetical protein